MNNKLKKRPDAAKPYGSDYSRALWDRFPVYPPENKEKIIKLQESIRHAHLEEIEKTRNLKKHFKTKREHLDYHYKNFRKIQIIWHELKKLYAEHDRLEAQYKKDKTKTKEGRI